MSVLRSALVIAIVGFIAEIIDGTLGMGYGVSSSALLITIGIAPVAVSASVHISETIVALASGISHFTLGNVRKDIFYPLAVAGAIGGSLGAYELVRLPVTPVKIIVSLILLTMGGAIFYRFVFRHEEMSALGFRTTEHSAKKLIPLGLFAGFIDAIGGGGWGPICTPTLVMARTEPRKVIGSVNLAEFFVTLAISATFFISVGTQILRWDIIVPLLVAGLIAAPISAYASKKLPHRTLGILVGLVIMILSIRTMLRVFGFV